MTGPTGGGLIELADTGLVIRVEADAQQAGDEFRTGFGKTARDGMHLRAATASQTCDVVVTNVTLLDPVSGIRTVSIGVREGRISAIGRAGNPDTLDGVDVVVGTGTTIIPGDGMLATPGAVDTHVHLLSPRVLEAALSSGVTTVIGHQPHAAVRPGRGGRAPGHDRVGARPGPGARRRAGPGPDPGRHDGGRGSAARPRRNPDHLVGRAGHGA